MAHLINSMPDSTQPEGVQDTREVQEISSPADNEDIQRLEREEQQALELAVDIAVTDETERDELAGSLDKAWGRLGAAAAELLKASFAVLAAIVARRLLARSAARAAARIKERGKHTPAGVRLGTLALADLLGHRIWGRVPGSRRMLLMLGAKTRTETGPTDGTEGKDPGTLTTAISTTSLKAGSRTYRAGLGASGLGHAAGTAEAQAADTPLVRVLLGVSVTQGVNQDLGEDPPLYRVRRFVKNEAGRYDEVAGYRSPDPDAAYRAFASNPSLADLRDTEQQ